MTQEKQTVERPSTILSGVLIWLLKYGSLIVAFASLALGVGLVVSSFIQFDMVNTMLGQNVTEIDADARARVERLTLVIGIVFLFLSFVLMVIKWLSGMVLLRNSYIQVLEKEKEIAYDKAMQDKENKSTSDLGQSVR